MLHRFLLFRRLDNMPLVLNIYAIQELPDVLVPHMANLHFQKEVSHLPHQAAT